MEWLSAIADVIGILGAIFALFAWLKSLQIQRELRREQQRLRQQIKVVLSYGPQTLALPVHIRRSELTRAEVLGRIGMLPMQTPGARFSLGATSTPEFLRRLDEIVDADGDTTLTIPCTKEEFEQFAL